MIRICLNAVLACFLLAGITLAMNYFLAERTRPLLISSLPTHWNLKDDLFVDFSDESGLRKYEIEVLLDSQVLYIAKEVILRKPKTFSIPLPKPPSDLKNKTTIQYRIKVTDWSNANLFTGNTTTLDSFITIDTIPPQIEVVATSPKISRSGSALVIFQVKDIALDSLKISNGKNQFQAFHYQPKGIALQTDTQLFASFIAWPLQNTFFEASITATDKALNTTKIPIEFNKNLSAPIRKTNIRLKESFLESKIAELMHQIDSEKSKILKNDKERFVFINEIIRHENKMKIAEASTLITSHKSYVNEFVPFAPLKNSRVVGFFGDKRNYYLNKEHINTATHMGIDLVSTKQAPIVASNAGLVTMKRYLGLYGNTLMLYHGFGLSSLYAHLSSFCLKVGDEVKTDDVIGYTGSSGWSFGDHLHLEILVQGYPVALSEWMNPKWIEENVNNVFKLAQARLSK